MHPALFERSAPPAHVRDGERHMVMACEHDRAHGGTPRKRALSHRVPPAPHGAGLLKRRPLGLGGVAERALDHRIDDAVRRQRLEDPFAVLRERPARLRNGPARVLGHRHSVGVRVVEHRAGGAPGVGVPTMDEAARGVLGEERHRVVRHVHGTTAGSARLRGS